MKVKKFTHIKPSLFTKNRQVFLGRDSAKFYIGGPYYQAYVQIHLTDEQFLSLYKFMGKFINHKAKLKKG